MNFSNWVGPGAVYSLNPCTEAAARLAIEELIRRPLILVDVPTKPKLLALKAETDESEPIPIRS